MSSASRESVWKVTMGERQWQVLFVHQELVTSRKYTEVACCVPPSDSSVAKMAGGERMSKILMNDLSGNELNEKFKKFA